MPPRRILVVYGTAHGVDRLGRTLAGLAAERVDLVLLDRSLHDAERFDGVRAARAAAERAARARDEVLGVVSHDLRTPLGTIAMCARALRDPDADRAELSDVIARSADWSLRVIRDLLDVTAIEAGRLALRPEPMAPDAIVEAVEALFAPLAAAEGVELAREHGGAPRWVDVDVDRLVQALGNLVVNAITFTPRGGRVTVAAGVDGGGAPTFRVSDTGRGIAPDHLPHLFDRTWQARTTGRGGVGLGLAIAKGIVEAHGGTIAVESAPGLGTRFTCTIPAGATGMT
jgi:signal transduction histidine kinase